MTFNYSIKKNLILLLAIQPDRIYATKNGVIIMAHGRKAVVKYNPSTHLCSVGVMGHFHCKERIIKDVPLERVLSVIYKHIGKHPMFFKYLSAWM